MPHVLQPSESRRFRVSLNTDGRAHPLENILAFATLALGVIAFVATFFTSAHVISSWFGVIGFTVGLLSQYISVTTPQRSVNIVGLVASFVGAALGIAHGGFLP